MRESTENKEAQVPALQVYNCVILDKLHNLSELKSSRLLRRGESSCLAYLLGDQVVSHI